MLKKCLFIGLAVMLIGSLGAVIGCGSGISGVAGTYVSQNNPSCYLELKKDGTYYSHEWGTTFTGDWELEGNQITLTSPLGIAVTGTIEGDTIITDATDPFTGENIIYKKGKPTEESTLAPPEEEELPFPPEQTEEGVLYSLSNYPQNPKTAAEVVVACYFLCKEEKMQEVLKLCGVEGIIEYPETLYVPPWAGQLEFLEINDVSEEKTIIRWAIFTSPTAVWLRGSKSKDELMPLMRKENLFTDIGPYELDNVVYTRAVAEGRYGEFADFLDEEELQKVRIIRVTKEYTKRDVTITLYFKNGNEESQTIEAIKVGNNWKVGLPPD